MGFFCRHGLINLKAQKCNVVQKLKVNISPHDSFVFDILASVWRVDISKKNLEFPTTEEIVVGGDSSVEGCQKAHKIDRRQ